MKVVNKASKPRAVQFADISIYKEFAYKGCLYYKIAGSCQKCNAINLNEGTGCTLSATDWVVPVYATVTYAYRDDES